MGRGNSINQVYVPYWKWECYRSGMWSKVDQRTEKEMLKAAIDFTGDYMIYGRAMIEVSEKWKYSMINFLTNKSINRKAYIGHCAVFYKLQIPEYIVRMAWKSLSEQQQTLANRQAENAIKLWEKKQLEKSSRTLKTGSQNATKMGFQMSLPLK